MKTKDTKGNLSFRLIILIFVVLAAGILAAGHFFYSNYANSYRAQAESQLSAVADLKIAELVQWRKERLGDADQLYKNAAFSGLVQRYFEHPEDVDTQEQLRSWLNCFMAYDQYSTILLLDTRGAARISVPDTAEPVPRHIPQDAYQALKSGKVIILDLDSDQDTPQIHMVILTPIFSQKDDNLPLGVVVMRVDPSHYLYPLIQKWPAPSATAETLLIRRESNDALFLNELKFQKDTALKLRSSLENIKMPAVQAALGHEGIMEGLDYRGVPVIADVRAVPDSPWFLIASMDIAEVYAPLIQMLWLIIAIIGALWIGAGAGVGLVWRQQNIRIYKQRAEIAHELRESEERWQFALEGAGDGVWEWYVPTNQLYFSPRWKALIGYGENEIGNTLDEWDKRLHQYDYVRVYNELGRHFEGVTPVFMSEYRLLCKDGNYRWMLGRGKTVTWTTEGQPLRVVGTQTDITARKQAEESLKSEQLMLARTEGIAHVGSWQWDIATDTVTWSEELFRIFQRDPQEGAPSFAKHPALYHPDDFALLNQSAEAAIADGTPYELELRAIRKDGEIRVCVARGVAQMGLNGQAYRLFGSLQDITERKQAEEELEKSRRELRSLSMHLISLREEERKLLAREIHDELGQALTALKMDLYWLSKKLPEGPNGEKIATMLSLVNTTMKMVKRLSTELRPGLLDDLGLVAAMEWQAGEFQARTDIKTGLGFEPADIIVDNERATAIFRIFQEVLTNVARHAAATSVDAFLRKKDRMLALIVSDNGKGIGQNMINSSKSLGLIGMRERCHHLGGTIDIRGKRGKGTTVTVNFPDRMGGGGVSRDKNTGG